MRISKITVISFIAVNHYYCHRATEFCVSVANTACMTYELKLNGKSAYDDEGALLI